MLLAADTEEHKSLVQGLVRIKDTIFQVNAQVSEYEKAARLRDIIQRLEAKSQGRQKDGKVLRREDLIQGGRTLLHEGTITWKISGRQKGVWRVFCFFCLDCREKYKVCLKLEKLCSVNLIIAKS